MDQLPQMLDRQVHERHQLKYLLSLPKEYGGVEGRKWPLILFLHGAGERGDDLEAVKWQGIPRKLEKLPDFPFITVSPQCPAATYWPLQVERLGALLDEIIEHYAVDEDRVYLTGLSMGGMGTWHTACRYPDRFAAIAPVCGAGLPHMMQFISHLPVWVFHGAKDSIVPLRKSEEMVEALKKYGAGDVRFTVYPEADHDSWTEAYNTPELYEWFLSHSRNSR